MILQYLLDNMNLPPSSRGLGHFPFTEVTGIRIPLGVLIINKEKAPTHMCRRFFFVYIYTANILKEDKIPWIEKL